MEKKIKFVSLALFGLAVIAAVLWLISNTFFNPSQEKEVTNFSQCLMAGYPVLESDPRKCTIPGKQIFVEEISTAYNDNQSPLELPTEGDDETVACTMDAMQCPDGSFVGRVAPDCEFAACPSE